MRLYKGHTYILGRSSSTEKLYDEVEASMDTLQDFAPTDTTGFIAIQSIRYVSPEEQPTPHNAHFSCLQAQEVRSAEGRGGRVPQSRMSFGRELLQPVAWAPRKILKKVRRIAQLMRVLLDYYLLRRI